MFVSPPSLLLALCIFLLCLLLLFMFRFQEMPCSVSTLKLQFQNNVYKKKFTKKWHPCHWRPTPGWPGMGLDHFPSRENISVPSFACWYSLFSFSPPPAFSLVSWHTCHYKHLMFCCKAMCVLMRGCRSGNQRYIVVYQTSQSAVSVMPFSTLQVNES